MAREVEGFQFVTSIPRFFLRIYGVWPGSKASKVGFARYSSAPAIIIMIWFINLPQTVQVFRVGKDLNAILRLLTTTDVPVGVAVLKMIGFTINQNVLHQLIVSVSDDWKKATGKFELDIMWKMARVSRLYQILCVGMTQCAVLMYSVLASYVTYKAHSNYAGDEEFDKPLYMTGKLPYNTNSSPAYEITWFMQAVAAILASGSFGVIDSFFVSLVFHLCGQLVILQNSIKNLTDSENMKETTFIKNISKIVLKHSRISQFANTIEDAFNKIFLVQILVIAAVLILQAYQLVMITTAGDGTPMLELIFMANFILCFMFSLFLYCYVAEILRTESMAVGYAAYDSDWYNLPPLKAKLIIFIMLRTKQPYVITAGKFADFSLELYCSILKSSGGYLSMLLAVRDRLVS